MMHLQQIWVIYNLNHSVYAYEKLVYVIAVDVFDNSCLMLSGCVVLYSDNYAVFD